MAENLFKEWIKNGCDLEEGRRLYALYGPRYRPNPALQLQISQFSNSLTKDILREELALISDLVTEKTKPKPAASPRMLHKLNNNENLPEDLRELSIRQKTLYKSRDAYRVKMRDLDSGPTLRDMAMKIVSMDLEIRKNWKVLDFWEKTGMYPPDWAVEKKGEQGKIEQLTFWLRALKSYPSFISRNKNNKEKSAEVAEKMKVLEEINSYLNATEEG